MMAIGECEHATFLFVVKFVLESSTSVNARITGRIEDNVSI